MDGPDLGRPVLGQLPQHRVVPVVAPATWQKEGDMGRCFFGPQWPQPPSGAFSHILAPLPFTSRIRPSNIWLQMWPDSLMLHVWRGRRLSAHSTALEPVLGGPITCRLMVGAT